MKITRRQLTRIIKEELSRVVNENFDPTKRLGRLSKPKYLGMTDDARALWDKLERELTSSHTKPSPRNPTPYIKAMRDAGVADDLYTQIETLLGAMYGWD